MSENIILALIGLAIIIITTIVIILYFSKATHIGVMFFDKKTNDAYFSFTVDPKKLRPNHRYSIKIKNINEKENEQ